MIRIPPGGNLKPPITGVTGFILPEFDVPGMGKKISLTEAVVAVIVIGFAVSLGTNLSLIQSFQGLIGGVISASIPAVSLPLANPGELVSTVAGIVMPLVEMFGLSQIGIAVSGFAAGGIALIVQYRRS